MTKQIVIMAAMVSLVTAPAIADERVSPIKDPIVKKECGACHMAFQPRFLPRQSWQKLMGGLQDHFGEDATLDEKTRLQITDYLVKNSRNSRNGESPLRITELGWFVSEHRGEVSRAQKKRAGKMSNCTACHRDADRGNYDDD